MEAHDKVVSAISARVKVFYEEKKPFRIYHGATNSTRRSHRSADNTIDTSQLNHVLSVDETAKTAFVEPNVPMDMLVSATLKHGLVPMVVMELPGITTGGGFSGTSGESSSFRYGAFDANINFIEIVLPDGTVTKASKTENQDLLWGAASAFGTLGVVTLLEVQLRDAKTHVRLEYSLSRGPNEMLKKLEAECAKENNDYVDAVVFSMEETVVCVGQFTDDLPQGTKLTRFMGRSDPWFYTRAKQVQKQLRKSDLITDYIPLEDYLFRYDRGGFWTAVYAFRYFLTPFNRITRYILDPVMHAREMYRAVHKSGLADYYMVQDVGVPYDRVDEFQSWLDKELHIYPLWICPLRIRRDDPDSAHGIHSEFADPNVPNLMNFGVWGGVKGNRREVIDKNRALEKKVQELGGKKWLYAHAYYTEEEFWANYDKGSYDALRVKYKATHLPTVYDKVKVDVEGEEAARRATWKSRAKAGFWDLWPLAGFRGFKQKKG
ncbi:Delta(24)-sterol reductase-like protein [Cladobotryum mycophilum]|uniref:Delta(24)-sterol reductase n=1 Tax=Cladobotryum mycophilum TaxID=491253 RepID=A0ABR0SNU0_9HYPO